MKHNLQNTQWWGAPKKFTTENEERKISWLELFYDLVYVIAISTITHYVAMQFSSDALLDYLYLFGIIFWGWLNGSLYHDLHGSTGLRTKLMTLWQMVIIAALVIILHGERAQVLHNATIVLLIMQLYITYIWWSVGFYDKAHRRLNKPYTIIYLISFLLMLLTLFLKQPYVRIFFFISLLLNYIPPFITHKILRRNSDQLTLSPSMTERLGLFTIIIFGEVVLGVINGTMTEHHPNVITWVQFVLAISIVFSLWWLFFTIISDKECKPGLVNASIFQLLFIPTLIGLGMLGASFTGIFKHFYEPEIETAWVVKGFGFSISLFLLGIWAMMSFLKYPEVFLGFKKPAKRSFLITAVVIATLTCLPVQVALAYHLLIVLAILIGLILYLNSIWYMMMKKQKMEKEE